MKTKIYKLFIIMAALVVPYIVAAFTFYESDPKKWDSAIRFLVAFISISSSVLLSTMPKEFLE